MDTDLCFGMMPKLTCNNGLRETNNYGASDIVTYTNSELITNQMIGIFQVRKQNLKPLY